MHLQTEGLASLVILKIIYILPVIFKLAQWSDARSCAPYKLSVFILVVLRKPVYHILHGDLT